MVDHRSFLTSCTHLPFWRIGGAGEGVVDRGWGRRGGGGGWAVSLCRCIAIFGVSMSTVIGGCCAFVIFLSIFLVLGLSRYLFSLRLSEDGRVSLSTVYLLFFVVRTRYVYEARIFNTSTEKSCFFVIKEVEHKVTAKRGTVFTCTESCYGVCTKGKERKAAGAKLQP